MRVPSSPSLLKRRALALDTNARLLRPPEGNSSGRELTLQHRSRWRQRPYRLSATRRGHLHPLLQFAAIAAFVAVA